MHLPKWDVCVEHATAAWRVFAETANPHSQQNEKLEPHELKKQSAFESIDYHKSYPQMYVEHLRANDTRNFPLPPSLVTASNPRPVDEEAMSTDTDRGNHAGGNGASGAGGESWFSEHRARSAANAIVEEITAYDASSRNSTLRWLLHVLIAVTVGLIATGITYSVAALEEWRRDTLYKIVVDRPSRSLGYFLGLLFWCGSALMLTAIGTIAVVWFEPAAGGSGIPDVIAYLNGVLKPKVVNFKTFVAKSISCVFAVAGGLPVGVEAPLIHLGAIAGAGVTQGRSRTLGCQTRLFQAFRNNKDRRDFITAGAACGVSAAFGAPIGGLLFVMEEVSSFWDHSASGQVFLASMISFSTIAFINSLTENDHTIGRVTNAAAVLFEVNIRIPLNLLSVIPSLFLGALCGLLAVVFTKCSLILIRWRRRVVRPFLLRRFAEPMIIVFSFSLLMYVLALIPSCQPTMAAREVNTSNGVLPWQTENVSTLVNLTCHEEDTYSPLATLALGSGKQTIRHLFNRQSIQEFPPATVFLFFLFYTIFACWSSGTFVASGLVVPTICMGAAFGRLFGLVLVHSFSSSGPVPNAYLSSEAWMDPGVFALIGAGALLGGINRMTMSICVIMVELSGELHYLLPIMVAIVMSKAMADWLCEPLFHQMLHLDSVPYLPMHLPKEFEQLTAADVMTSPVVTLRIKEETRVVLEALRSSTHHAFPIIVGDASDRSSVGSRQKFVGVVTREDIQVFLSLPSLQHFAINEGREHAAASTSTTLTRGRDDALQTPLRDSTASPSGPSIPAELSSSAFNPASAEYRRRLEHLTRNINAMSWVDWMRHQTSLFFVIGDKQWHLNWTKTNTPDAVVDEALAASPAPGISSLTRRRSSSTPSSSGSNPFYLNEQQLPKTLDLSLIVNRSPWVIPPFFNLSMAYTTFRSMGLRHMVVVDGDDVKGMITRKDLLINTLRGKLLELHLRLREAAMVERTRLALERIREEEQARGETSHLSNASILSLANIPSATSGLPASASVAPLGARKGDSPESHDDDTSASVSFFHNK